MRRMKLLGSIVADVVYERSMDARREDAVHGFELEGSEDRNEAHNKLKLEEKIEILMIV